jgi:16S rRNA G966 N2-methylase RsmD
VKKMRSSEKLRNEKNEIVNKAEQQPDVYARPIQTHSREGDAVLSLWSGTGAVGVSAIMHGRHVYLIDNRADQCEAIVKRLSLLKEKLEENEKMEERVEDMTLYQGKNARMVGNESVMSRELLAAAFMYLVDNDISPKAKKDMAAEVAQQFAESKPVAKEKLDILTKYMDVKEVEESEKRKDVERNEKEAKKKDAVRKEQAERKEKRDKQEEEDRKKDEEGEEEEGGRGKPKKKGGAKEGKKSKKAGKQGEDGGGAMPMEVDESEEVVASGTVGGKRKDAGGGGGEEQPKKKAKKTKVCANAACTFGCVCTHSVSLLRRPTLRGCRRY